MLLLLLPLLLLGWWAWQHIRCRRGLAGLEAAGKCCVHEQALALCVEPADPAACPLAEQVELEGTSGEGSVQVGAGWAAPE